MPRRKISRREFRQLLVSFALMIALTVLAFYAISSENIDNSFAIPFVVVLAILQVAVQLIIFMHLKEDGHGYERIFISAGVLIATVTVAILIHTRML